MGRRGEVRHEVGREPRLGGDDRPVVASVRPAAVPEVDRRARLGRRPGKRRGRLGRGRRRGGIGNRRRAIPGGRVRLRLVRLGRLDLRAVGHEGLALGPVRQIALAGEEEVRVQRRELERPRHPRRVGGAADERALEDDVHAVAVGEDVDAVELGGLAGEDGVRGDLVPVEDEAGRQAMDGGGRVRRRRIRDGGDVVQRAGRERRVDGGLARAPGPVADGGKAVGEVAVGLAHRADPPVDDVRPRRGLVERVVLALVGRVRLRPDDLVRLLEPDVVGARAVDRRPLDETRVLLAGLLRRHGRPAHVEAVGRAPGARRAARRDRAHVGVDRVRVTDEPGKGGGDGRGRRLQRVRGVDDRALVERVARRELELVEGGVPDGVPRERRRPRERPRRRLARAEQEGAQPGRRRRRAGRPPRGLGAGDEAEGREQQDGTANDGHRSPGLSARLRPRGSLERGTPRRRGRGRRRPIGRRAGPTREGRPPRDRTAARAPASRAR